VPTSQPTPLGVAHWFVTAGFPGLALQWQFRDEADVTYPVTTIVKVVLAVFFGVFASETKEVTT
jgi:hypothetical protein